MTTKTAAQRGTAVSVKSLAITAICLVLVYVFTAVVNIRLPFAPNGGLIHLGNVPLFVAAILFGKRTGMIAGGIGMALFDLLSGWTLWAPFTLVIVGCMGFVVGAVTEKKKSFPFYLLALLLALSLAAMLVISLTERFKHPQITVHVQPAPQAPAGMGGDAIGALMQEVAKNPQNVDALLHLVEALMTAQNWEAAETFAQRASTLDVNNPQPLYLLGVIKHNQGKHKEAAELLEKVVALHDNASVRYSLGVLYIHFLNDPARGVEHLSAGLHDPKAGEDLKKGIRDELEKAPLSHAGGAENNTPDQPVRQDKMDKKAKKTNGKDARP